MLFEQFHIESLGHASYLVGDEATGAALILDPQRRVDGYLDAARRHGLRIELAIDTHGHNDYLSGLAELSGRTSVTLLGSAHAQLGYDHRAVKDGEIVQLGKLSFEVLHTPGHTPEHVSLLVYDHAVGDEPAMLLSGGALLVGDVARPDLLGVREDIDEAARTFARTLQEKILTLPDHVEVFPTHVSGSLCGGHIGSRLWTTIGYERRTNPVLAQLAGSTGSESEDVTVPTDDLPAVPPYWRRMRSQNLAGVAPVGALREPEAVSAAGLETWVGDGAVALDLREPEAFAGAHVPGSLNVALGSSFPTWAGTVLPEGARVVLVTDDPADVPEATWELLRIGYEPPVAWLAGGMRTWRTSAKPFARLASISAAELHDRRQDYVVLDVRQPAEWSAGRIAASQLLTGAELPARLDEVSRDRPVAVLCGSGFRSSVAASLLQASGHEVVNVLGGISAWRKAGLPLER